MDTITCTVFFEDPFFVAVLERRDADGGYSASKHTFGAEPKSNEVWEFVLSEYRRLRFSDPETDGEAETTPLRRNPKRLQREAAKAISAVGVGTKAQEALKAQYEQNKLACKTLSREERDAEAERQFALRQAKKKAKHRGH